MITFFMWMMGCNSNENGKNGCRERALKDNHGGARAHAYLLNGYSMCYAALC